MESILPDKASGSYPENTFPERFRVRLSALKENFIKYNKILYLQRLDLENGNMGRFMDHSLLERQTAADILSAARIANSLKKDYLSVFGPITPCLSEIITSIEAAARTAVLLNQENQLIIGNRCGALKRRISSLNLSFLSGTGRDSREPPVMLDITA